MNSMAEIKNYISLKAKVPQDDLSDDLSIIESGIIRSMAVLEMVAHLENAFSIEFDANDLNEKSFETLRSLADLVDRTVLRQKVKSARPLA